LSGLRILLANVTLAARSGTEIYVRDLALALVRRGHTPIVYSPLLGNIARELRDRTVPVTDNVNSLSVKPDIIHGQHNLETVTAMLRFPGVPVVYFFHDGRARHSVPPRGPRILHYVAVDDARRDQLVFEYGIEERRVSLLPNAVDLARFQPRRRPLPERPRRALAFFSGHAPYHLEAIRTACARRGVQLDVVGTGVGKVIAAPEQVLGDYDLVFAKGRCALEALASGAGVIVSHSFGMGPLVTAANVEKLRGFNFGRRAVCYPLAPDAVEREILRYRADDVAEVTRYIRATAGQEQLTDAIVEIYEEVMDEFSAPGAGDTEEECRALAEYARWLSFQFHLEHRPLLELASERLRSRLRSSPLLRKIRRVAGRDKVKSPLA
jgi:hypothetical protein